LIPVYTRLLASGDLGAIDLLVVIGNLANLVLALEISQSVARFLPAAASATQRSAYASTAFWFTIASYSVALVIALSMAVPLAIWVFESTGNERTLYVALPALWANGMFYFLQNQLRWQMRPRAHALASLTHALTSAAIAVGLVVYADSGVVGVFWGQLGGALAGSAYALIGGAEGLRPRIDMGKFREMLAFSSPLVVSSLAALTAIYADRIIIKEFLSVADLGVYGVAQRLAATVSLVLAGFQATLTPLVTHAARDPAAPLQISRSLRYFLALALPAVLALGMLSRELVMLFATPMYYPAHSLIPVLAAAVLIAGMYVFVPGLWLARKTRVTMGINMATAALSIALNLVLVPSFGLPGGAAATLASAIAGFGAYVILGQRHFPVEIAWKRLVLASAILSLLPLAGASLGDVSITATAIRFGMLACGAALVAYILLGASELRQIIVHLSRPAASR